MLSIVRFLRRQLIVLSIASAVTATSLVAQDARLSDDASVSSATPNANNGAAATMIVRGNSNSLNRGFIRFDLSNIPSGTTSAQVAKSVLTLYVSSLNTAGSVNVLLVSGSW